MSNTRSMRIDKLRVNKLILSSEYTTPNPIHIHFGWELLIFEKGISQNIVDDVSYTAVPGDVFLLGPGHLHGIDIDMNNHLHRDIYFTEAEIKRHCDLFSPQLFEDIKSKNKLMTLKLNPPVFETVTELCDNLDRLYIESALNNYDNLDSLKGISFAVLQLLLSIYFSNQSLGTLIAPDFIYTIIQNSGNPAFFTQKVDDIVALSNYSHVQFLRIFKEYMGVSIVKYLSLKRMEYAAELLKSTNKSVLEICSLSGYDALSFFIKCFKSIYKTTPLQYRKRHTGTKHI